MTRSTRIYHSPITIAETQMNQNPQIQARRHTGKTKPQTTDNTAWQPAQNSIGRPRRTGGDPGASASTYSAFNWNDKPETAYSFGAQTSRHLPPLRDSSSVRFSMADNVQIPPIWPNNSEHIGQRNLANEQNASDNDSEHGSNTGSISRHEQSEAQKAFRHVLRTPNPEKFAGDKDRYHL